jgi:hypothetical protein
MTLPGFKPPIIQPIAQYYTTELSQLLIHTFGIHYLVSLFLKKSISPSVSLRVPTPEVILYSYNANRNIPTIFWVYLT